MGRHPQKRAAEIKERCERGGLFVMGLVRMSINDAVFLFLDGIPPNFLGLLTPHGGQHWRRKGLAMGGCALEDGKKLFDTQKIWLRRHGGDHLSSCYLKPGALRASIYLPVLGKQSLQLPRRFAPLTRRYCVAGREGGALEFTLPPLFLFERKQKPSCRAPFRIIICLHILRKYNAAHRPPVC